MVNYHQNNYSKSSTKLRDLVISIIKEQKPQTCEILLDIVQKKTGLSADKIKQLLIDLENEDITFFNKEDLSVNKSKAFFSSMNSVWFWCMIVLATVSTIVIFAVPDNSYPMLYIRSVLGILFTLFLPGFAFTKAFYPSRLPIQTSSQNLDLLERFVLSVSFSIAIIIVVCLILNYTPWGLSLVPITLTLFVITVLVTTTAAVREYKIKVVYN